MLKKMIICAGIAALAGLTGCSSQKESANSNLTPMTITQASFAELDLNGDGSISYDEFELATNNQGSLEGNAVYISLDKDGNGLISEEEFSAAK